MMDNNFLSVTTPSPNQSHPTILSNVIITVITSLFLIVGTIGSLTTAVVIAKNKHLHSKANIFIFSLCLSDLISALVCSPIWLYRRTWGYEYWHLSNFLCQFYWISDYATNYITSLLIVSFSILRYTVIKRPIFEASLSKANVICFVISVWILSLVFALPLGYLMEVDFTRKYQSVGSCWPSCSLAIRNGCCAEQYKIYIAVVNPLLFYLPQICIILFSSLLALEIRKNARKRREYFNVRSSPSRTRDRAGRSEVIANSRLAQLPRVSTSIDQRSSETFNYGKVPSLPWNPEIIKQQREESKERKAFLQLMLIVIAYGIGYIPTVVYLQWSITVPGSNKGVDADYWFGITSYLALRLSECMNPFVYNAGSSNLRKETKIFYRKLFSRNS